MSRPSANNVSHIVFWISVTLLAFGVFMAREPVQQVSSPTSTTQVAQKTDKTDAKSDVSVASRKIRSDGQESKGSLAIPFSPIIPCPQVNDLLVDSRGTLWVATEKSLLAIDSGQVKEYSNSRGTFPAPQAECLAFDGQKIWVGTLFGLYSTTRSGKIEKHQVSNVAGSEIILDLAYDGVSLWVATQAGVAFMDKDGKFVIIDSHVSNGGLRNDWCQNIMRFSSWFVVTHDSGISFWNTGFKASNPEFWKNIDNARSSIVRPITGLTFDGNHIWVATSRGVLYLITPLEKLFSESVSNFVNFTTVHGLPSNRINAIISHRNSVWVGTNNGLARISEEKIQTIIPIEGNSNPKILALAASGDILWLGTDRGIQFVNTAMVE